MNCVETVTRQLQSLSEVDDVQVSLNPPEMKVTSSELINTEVLQEAIGSYQIVDEVTKEDKLPTPNLQTYKPLMLIVAFLLGVTILVQFPFTDFDLSLWMRHFMAGFFIVFAFFKLLNIKGFAESYQMYDVIAGRWKFWGHIYPFIELGLGIFYLINFQPFLTNLLTIFILGVSSIGVIKSNLTKRKIKCACLGDVFNLPMSTVTIVEDLTMVGMALIMIL